MKVILKARNFAAAIFLSLAASAAAAQESEAYDTSRIVTIGGSITEIVYALGEGDRLVARDTTSVYPQAALELPDIGYIRRLSPEGVLSVNPTLIIALEGSGPPETVEVLANARVPMVTVPESYDGEGILEKIRIVGATLGVQDEAELLADEVGRAIDEVLAQTGSQAQSPDVLFIISMSGGRIMASGTGTAADGAIAMAGGQNAISGFEGYRQLTDEAIIEAAPDVILMMDRQGMHDAGEDEVLAHPAIAPTPAGRNRQVIRMNGAYLLNFGPRTAEAVQELAGRLRAARKEP